MKRLRDKMKEFLISARDGAGHRLRMLCGKPSPMKRFIIVLVIGGTLAAANIYFVVSSIYNIGKSDAGKELLELETGGSRLRHTGSLELKNDSINQLKKRLYEYERKK